MYKQTLKVVKLKWQWVANDQMNLKNVFLYLMFNYISTREAGDFRQSCKSFQNLFHLFGTART